MSTRPARSLQEWLHWFEIGSGSNWVRIVAMALGALILTFVVVYKQFRGPLTETTFAQAVVGRQIAEGGGVTTPVNYPQSFAWAQSEARRSQYLNMARPLPELHQPPLYSLVIAAGLRVFSAKGAGADYVLLGINVALLWCAALQTFFLGRKLFGVFAGVVAMCALLLSSPVWAAAMAVNGAVLTMVLWLALFHLVARVEWILLAESERASWALPLKFRYTRSIAGGALCGLLFLSDYAAIVGLVLLIGHGWLRSPGWRRLRVVAVMLAGFALIAGPWMVRNMTFTGNPLAYAAHGLALKAGDPTAEPAAARATFSTAAPEVDVNKLGNKVLTSLQRGFGERLWSGGGLFLAAFFVAGLVYRFRDERANRIRWFAVEVLVALAVFQAFFDSGEGERGAWLCLAPLIMITGAGFFTVLLTSSETLAPRAGLVALALLAVQAVPLARDLAAPRGAHSYNYPPYLPSLFEGMGRELARGRDTPLAWMADVPAGAAWYSRQRVWAQPATLEGFEQASAWQPVRALVLTPATLSRPFFGELLKARPGAEASRPGGAAGAPAPGAAAGWPDVYRGLITGRLPDRFPLKMTRKITDGFYVFIDPATPATGK